MLSAACLMNGSNHLEESDSRPMHLCPILYPPFTDALDRLNKSGIKC